MRVFKPQTTKPIPPKAKIDYEKKTVTYRARGKKHKAILTDKGRIRGTDARRLRSVGSWASALSSLKRRVGCHVHARVDMPETSMNMPTQAWAWHPRC